MFHSFHCFSCEREGNDRSRCPRCPRRCPPSSSSSSSSSLLLVVRRRHLHLSSSSSSSSWFCGPEESKRFLSRTPNAQGKKPNPGKPTKKQPRTRISCKHGNGSGVLSDRPDRKNTERGNASVFQ